MSKLLLRYSADPFPIFECQNEQKARNGEQNNADHQDAMGDEPKFKLKELSLREQELHVSLVNHKFIAFTSGVFE